jgi:hypothetical protein
MTVAIIEGSVGSAPPGLKVRDAAHSHSGIGDLLLYVALAALVLGAWGFSQRGYFKAGDDLGYWIGVAGGVMMVLLFSYPLRKHFKVFLRWGKVKWWFLVHMILGIGGPLLILLHSTFRVGSINAAVALYSMLIVAGSGVIGRFLFIRVNRGLHGEKTTLRHLQARAGMDQSETRSKLHFAASVEARLLAFEARELAPNRSAWTFARQAALLPLQKWLTYRACCMELDEPLAQIARQRGWSDADRLQRERLAKKLVRRYLNGVVRVAQFSAYARLFALWHVAHVPFVYLMVISSIAHVIAVHAY